LELLRHLAPQTALERRGELMLRRLTLRDFVIVTTLDVELHAGFTALTGETGAGKSILIDALQLALGGRGDAGVVREGAARADICAEFDIPPALAEQLQPWLHDAGFDVDENAGPSSTLGTWRTWLLRRVIDTQGKSRAWINGVPATVTQLRQLGDHLVDIHGQHAWQRLTRPDDVRALVDAQAGVDTAALQAAWDARRLAHQKLHEARQKQADMQHERERLQWQIAEIDKLAPGDDEWPELDADHRRLAHGQAILEATQAALQAVAEADDNADRLTTRAIHALQPVAGVDARLANALEVLLGAQAQLQDAAHSLHAVLRHTELDPDRLAALDQRMATWLGLARRFRHPPEALPELLKGWRQALAELDAATDLDALERAQAEAEQHWHAVAKQASRQRAQVAPALAAGVTTAMQTLGMAGGRFDVALHSLAEPQASGLETVEFLVAGHEGSTPRPLAKVASGGELSRLALAIAVTTLHTASAPTLIFDEIDAGVGGQVADTVGQLMQQLGDRSGVQVLSVTHLAQVAACAHHHLVVSKHSDQGVVSSDIQAVDHHTRVQELARMIGGNLTDTSLAHAQHMLMHAHALAHPLAHSKQAAA
jgi:DNA repair protein RecN (Recombination protein N)